MFADVSWPLWAPRTSVWARSKGCQRRESENKSVLNLFSCYIMASFENAFWTLRVFSAPLWCSCGIKKGQRGAFIIQESIELMKDSVPFNFISFTTALLLPFPEHKQIKGAPVIHLLCYQTVLLLGIAHRPTHTHTHCVTHLFLAFIGKSSNFSSPQGFYFWN